MTTINLLPWRERHIKSQNILFGMVAGGAAFVCVSLIFMASLFQGGVIKHKTKQLSYIKSQIGLLDGQIKKIEGLQDTKEELLSKREVIEALQASRPFIVKLLDNTARAVPFGVYISEINRDEETLTFKGSSESNSRISLFMKNLSRIDWVKDATLTEIKTVAANNDSRTGSEIEFQLYLNIDSGGQQPKLEAGS